MIEQYPFDSRVPKRTYIVAEAGRVSQVREQVRERLEQLAEQAARKRETFHPDVSGSPRETIDYDLYGEIMAERRKREAEQI